MLLSSEVAIGRLQSKYPDIDFSKSVYRGTHELLTAVCPKHGEITKKVTHWGINGCVQCNKERRQQPDYVHATPERIAGWKRSNERSRLTAKRKWDEWCLTEQGQQFDFSKSEYTKAKANITVRCKKHDVWFTGYPDSFLKGMNACPVCLGETIGSNKRLSIQERITQARSVHGDRYEYVYIPETRHEKAIIKCTVHGEFNQSFGNHLQGNGCPACVGATSRGELDLAEFVRSHIQIETKVRNVISPKELDIYVPSKNIGIEFNGLHWHSEQYAGTIHMRTKWEKAQEKGVRILNIFDDEWIQQRPIVERAIVAALGLSKTSYARQLTIGTVDKDTASTFLNEYHIGGNRNGSYRIGLYLDNNLEAVLVCGKHASEEWEIIRYASSHNIVGGFRRLFSRFIQDMNVTRCLSYCDLRYGSGKSYLDAGFECVAVTDPDYWWFKKLNRIPRYQTQKYRLKFNPLFAEYYSDDKSETEICTEAGYRRIWGVGHLKFIWTKK